MRLEQGSPPPTADRTPDVAGPLPTLLSAAEVGALFRRGERALRDWVRRGHLTPVRVGRSLFFREDDVRALIAGRLRDTVRRS